MSLVDISELQKATANLEAEQLLRFAAGRFAPDLVFATSLGAEDQVITDLIVRNRLPIPIVTLDTGRLFDETLTLLAETEQFFGIRIQVFFPDRAEVEAMVNEHGVNLFRQSVELRKRCCLVRKLLPLRRALAGRKLWICGQRKEQSVTRQGVELIEEDAANGLLKLNPLAEWSEERVWNHIKFHQLPYNPLHDRGYPSIGCAGCTRAVKKTEDVRAGRWSWEAPEHRECGLHQHKK